ncbi:hypothetical protein PIB30_043387, partial [Stylosanthes scabra]|nr:hypothetical protein [Stylosanthes scabra]
FGDKEEVVVELVLALLGGCCRVHELHLEVLLDDGGHARYDIATTTPCRRRRSTATHLACLLGNNLYLFALSYAPFGIGFEKISAMEDAIPSPGAAVWLFFCLPKFTLRIVYRF